MDLTAAIFVVSCLLLSSGLVGFVLYTAFRTERHQRELLNAERMAAIERGQELPPESFLDPEAKVGRKTGNTLKTGLIVLGLGSGLIAALRVASPATGYWGWGLLLVVVGLAHLVYWFVRGKTEWETAQTLELERKRALVLRPSNPDSPAEDSEGRG